MKTDILTITIDIYGMQNVMDFLKEREKRKWLCLILRLVHLVQTVYLSKALLIIFNAPAQFNDGRSLPLLQRKLIIIPMAPYSSLLAQSDYIDPLQSPTLKNPWPKDYLRWWLILPLASVKHIIGWIISKKILNERYSIMIDLNKYLNETNFSVY